MEKITRWIKSMALLSIILLPAFFSNNAKAQPGAAVSFQTFYDNLSPYGQWVEDPNYGNVWVPYAEDGFRPYGTRGHWVMTDYGNTWVSDYPWGWATFHYGRWTYDPYYGWLWIPGTEWAPAWVNWRYGGGTCGWAPLGPGISINIAVGGGWQCPLDWWVFVGPQYLYDRDPYHYWRGARYNSTYINQTTIINNTYIDNSTHVTYSYGPRAAQIQAVTHRNVPVYHLTRASAPGTTGLRNGTVSIYRPVVNSATVRTARPENVIRAPRAITRTAQPVSVNAGRTPFKQVVERQNPAMVRTASVALRNPTSPQAQPQVLTRQLNNSRPANNAPATRPMNTQPNRPPALDNRSNPTPVGRPQPAQQNFNRPQPAPRPQQQNFSRPQPAPRPQQQNFNRPQLAPRPQQQNFNRPQPAPRPMQQNFSRPQPAPRPMQQNFNRPQPAPRPQQQNFNRPQPAPRPMPQNFNRPQPAPRPMQQQHAQPPRNEERR